MKPCDCLVYGLGVVHMHYAINDTDSDVYLQNNNLFSIHCVRCYSVI